MKLAQAYQVFDCSRSYLIVQMSASIILALVILYFVGFSEISIAHNAAHDARHALIFPCH